MSLITLPPKDWQRQNQNYNSIDILKKINSNYKDDDLMFKVIKNDGNIKCLSKKECFSKAYQLASSIRDLIQKSEQIKLFGIISASEESVIFMLANLILGGNHCICFEELTHTAIATRIDVFKPDIILYRPISYPKVKKLKGFKKISNIESMEININLLSNKKSQILFGEYIRKYSKNDSFFTFTLPY